MPIGSAPVINSHLQVGRGHRNAKRNAWMGAPLKIEGRGWGWSDEEGVWEVGPLE
jgi:hypothetical protein